MNKLYFLFLACLLWPQSGQAIVGKIDNREYVDWTTAPYNRIVLFGGNCTGQYIAPDLILTAAHCVFNHCYDSELDLGDCFFTNSSGQSGTGRVIAVGREYSLANGIPLDGADYTPATDWALIKTEDLTTDSWFQVAPITQPGKYNSVGFGAIRIIDDDELPIIRKKYVLWLRQKYDLGRLVSSKKILEKTKLKTDMWHEFDEFLANVHDETGVSIAPLFPPDENRKLKAHLNCDIVEVKDGYFIHHCDEFHGNSGGGYFRGEALHGVTSSGDDGFADHE
ncbi:trypsin-like serine protease, partial [bacterium]|nr:trypsin-like serine protease [bacterium]